MRAIPGAGLEVPVWILGSSLYGAQLAAALGLPYAFASHFAPADLDQAVALYREQFQPSEQLAQPYVMPGLVVCAADTDAQARRLFSSHQQSLINRRLGRRCPLPPPVDDLESRLDPALHAILQSSMGCAVVGSPDAVKRGVEDFIARTGANELIITAQIFDHAARVRSYQIAAECCAALGKAA